VSLQGPAKAVLRFLRIRQAQAEGAYFGRDLQQGGRPMATINVTIKLTVTPQGEVEVSAVENPQTAKQADTVTWVFDPGSEDLRVVFKKVELANNSGALLIYEQGPFSRTLSRIGVELSGTIAKDAPDGRYLYDIHDGNNQPLKWRNPISKTRTSADSTFPNHHQGRPRPSGLPAVPGSLAGGLGVASSLVSPHQPVHGR
jgi:hypothetical protein